MSRPEQDESASETKLLSGIVEALSLGGIFEQSCTKDVERGIDLVFVAWDTVVASIGERQVEEVVASSPDRAAVVSALLTIYSTNWPNKAICECIPELYGKPVRAAWMGRDVREVLDIAVRSAVLAAMPQRVRNEEDEGA